MQLKDQLLSTGGRLAAEATAGYALKYAADLEGPLGLLVSEALSILSSEIAFKSDKPLTSRIPDILKAKSNVLTFMVGSEIAKAMRATAKAIRATAADELPKQNQQDLRDLISWSQDIDLYQFSSQTAELSLFQEPLVDWITRFPGAPDAPLHPWPTGNINS